MNTLGYSNQQTARHDAAPTPGAASKVREELETMEKAIAYMTVLMDTLEARTSAVCSPSPMATEKAHPNEQRSQASPLVEALRVATDRLHRINVRLQTVTDLMEL